MFNKVKMIEYIILYIYGRPILKCPLVTKTIDPTPMVLKHIKDSNLTLHWHDSSHVMHMQVSEWFAICMDLTTLAW